MHSRAEKIYNGIGVSHGISIGDAFVVALQHPEAPRRTLSAGETADEHARLEGAAAQARIEIATIRARFADKPDGGDEKESEDILLLLDAHDAMLKNSRLLRGAFARIDTQLLNAEAAVQDEVAALSAQFRSLGDVYIAARIDDVQAVGDRLLRILMDLPYMPLAAVPTGGIVLARNISPAETVLLDPAKFGGIATVLGGAAGHTAVVARSLGLPAVLGLPPDMLEAAGAGCRAIVDGIEGKLILWPSAQTEDAYRLRLQSLQHERDELSAVVALPGRTLDGCAVTLRANLELPREMDAVCAVNADGIGLFRTEFLFMNRDTLPTEEEQFNAIAQVVQQAGGAEVTFRTLDIGGDKLAASLGSFMADVANPALGLRAIRLSLKVPDLLITQFRAILRAGQYGPVRILLPMVTTAQEVEEARRILRQCWRVLEDQGVAKAAVMPPVGTMIEVPAAALSADSLAAVSDFFALGTNDLVQYTVAIDRGDEQVAALYNPVNPAVIRLMHFTIEAARRANLRLSICGEMAADLRYTALLIGLGIRDMSVGPANLLRLKKHIRSLNLENAQAHARAVLDEYDPEAIKALIEANRV